MWYWLIDGDSNTNPQELHQCHWDMLKDGACCRREYTVLSLPKWFWTIEILGSTQFFGGSEERSEVKNRNDSNKHDFQHLSSCQSEISLHIPVSHPHNNHSDFSYFARLCPMFIFDNIWHYPKNRHWCKTSSCSGLFLPRRNVEFMQTSSFCMQNIFTVLERPHEVNSGHLLFIP